MSDQPQDHPARRLSPRQTWLTALALSAITLATPVLLSTSSAQSPDATAVAADPALPFDPPTAAMKASPKKVFAHYVPSLTVSLDNKNPDVDYYTKNYLNPDGEGGKHSAYGGFVRDRPLGRPARSEANWRAIDMRTEVQQAKDAGLDGFVLDIFGFPGDSSSQVAQNVTLLLDAAAAVDPSFKILLMPDVSGGLKAKDSDTMARLVAQLGKHSAAYKLTDGRLVVSPFHTESHDAAWWKTFTELLAGKYATPVAFMPLFLNAASNLDAYAPFSYGIADWGSRNPAGNNPTATHPSSPKARIKAVHDKGLKWMQPVSVQDERPRSYKFEEAENTQNLRNTWDIAIKNDAEFVQLTTWNDYVEGTSFAPSAQHRRTLLDINAYYMAIYKTGQAPQIKRDTIYLSHRVQPHAAKPSYPETRLMQISGTSPARDKVEALTFLTAPGTVTLTVGGTATSCNVPAGPATCTAPLATGDVSATVTRNATVVSTVTSPFKVTNTPYVQDLGYVVTAGGQTATSAPEPAPVVTTPPPAPVDPAALGAEAARQAAAAAELAAATAKQVADQAAAAEAEAMKALAAAQTAAQQAQVEAARTAAEAQQAASDAAAAVQAAVAAVTKLLGTSSTLSPLADSYANQGAPTRNYGTDASLLSRGTLGGSSYLRFQLPAAPLGATLIKAELRVRTSTDASAGSTASHAVQFAPDGWAEGTLTWNNRPLPSGPVLGTLQAGSAASTTYTVPLDVVEVGKRLAGNATISITSAGRDALYLWSMNHANAGYRPQLVLTFR